MSSIKHLPKTRRHQLRNVIILTLISPVVLMTLESNSWDNGSVYSYMSYIGLITAILGAYLSIKLIRQKTVVWMSVILLLANLWYIFLNALEVLHVSVT